MILRDKLIFSIPMQRLYERVYFDNFNLEKCLAGSDSYNDGSVGVRDFVRVVTREVPSLGE